MFCTCYILCSSCSWIYILSNGKHAGKVKLFRVNAEAEEQVTNEQRIKLIKGTINHADVNYNRFDISNYEIITKHGETVGI